MKTVCIVTLFFVAFLTSDVRGQNLASDVRLQPEAFFPTELKDWVLVFGTIATVFGVLFGVWKGLAEWSRSTKQREEELKQRELEFRLKQAVYGREIINEVFGDPKSRAALEMLDWLRKKYTTEEGEVEVRRSDIQVALRAPGQRGREADALRFAKAEVFIRTRFEALYDRLEVIEKLITVGAINFEDLETVFRYYMIRAQRPEIVHLAFLDYYDYPHVKAFLLRFGAENNPGSGLSPSELVDDNIASVDKT